MADTATQTLTLPESSRYKDTPIIVRRTAKTLEFGMWVSDPDIREDADFSMYQVRNADAGRLDFISYLHYGTPSYGWVIAEANDLVDVFSDMPVGQFLRIPSRAVIDRFLQRGSRA